MAKNSVNFELRSPRTTLLRRLWVSIREDNDLDIDRLRSRRLAYGVEVLPLEMPDQAGVWRKPAELKALKPPYFIACRASSNTRLARLGLKTPQEQKRAR